MTITMIVASLMLLAVVALARMPRDVQVSRVPATGSDARAAARASRATPSAAKSAPKILELLEWHDTLAPLALDEAHARARDRYIAARFPGVIAGAADLANLPRAIEAARLYFDEGRFGRAHELLQLAIEVSPREPSLRLAQVEIAFLERERALFLEAAGAMRLRMPGLAEWREVQRLGCALAPEDKLFGALPANEGNEHHGRWPEAPNWLGCGADVNALARAGDFNRAMSRAASHAAAAPLRAAA